ncbi:endolytic transglycosylase MltG [Streptomyces humi]|uniref:endolytic transglycosylase MltG n=1 Tax=Streptomyces humi TaxID=1428620 RepID=UPI0008FC5EA4|nr:endolytic transglycosylase MltG [Streptomyces humi]
MTEYGRGPGSEPWHPEDPLYGDGGWGGQQAHAGQQSPYGGQPQHYPQQSQQQYGDWEQHPQGGYEQHQGQQQYAYYDEQGQLRYADGHAQQQYDQQYAGHAPQQYHQGTWDAAGTHGEVPYAADPGDPYGQQPVAYGGEQPDFYGTEDAYPPPEPPGRRREPEPAPQQDAVAEEEEQHPFFTGADDEDDEDDDDPKGRRGGGRGKDGKGSKGGKGAKKRRNGFACLVVCLVFGGGAATVGYFGWHFVQNRFGASPDYAGSGNSETVTVQIPKGAGGYEIGRRLKEAGVVKSVDAFVHAQSQNSKGDTIQAGAYTLKKEMSAASCVLLMLDPKSQANVVVTPGERAASVYVALDKKLGLSAGSSKKIARAEYKNLGLPSYANTNSKIMDPLEGFLYPGTYPAAKGMKPDAILKQMVAAAKEEYANYDLVAEAKKFDLENPLQVITVASLVQAEGKTHDDFRKMAEVIYNRLKPTNTETNRLLQFDSTFNYLKGTSNIHISLAEINSNQNPYNTYTQKGLPPGPIGNPGEDALKAALNPTDEGWIYFVATDGVNNTEFAKTNAEFEKLREKFNATSGH